MSNAEGLYRDAISLDSTFALAFVGLGEISQERIGIMNRSIFGAAYSDSVLYFASKAIANDQNLAEAYSLRGEYYGAQRRIEEAIQDQERAGKSIMKY